MFVIDGACDAVLEVMILSEGWWSTLEVAETLNWSELAAGDILEELFELGQVVSNNGFTKWREASSELLHA